MKPNKLQQFVFPILAFFVISSILHNSINSSTSASVDSNTKSEVSAGSEQKSKSDSTNVGGAQTTAHESSDIAAESQTSIQSAPVEQPPASSDTPPSNETSDSSEVNKSELSTNQISTANDLVKQVISKWNPQVPDALTESFTALQTYPKPAPGDTNKAETLNKLGLVELKNKNFDKAAQLFTDAGVADPSDAKLASNLGFAEMHAGKLDFAEQHLYSSLLLDPSRQVAWWDLGMTFAKKGEPDKAKTCLLIGQKCSGDQSLVFLRSLLSDADNSVREVAASALQSAPTVESRDPFAPVANRGE